MVLEVDIEISKLAILDKLYNLVNGNAREGGHVPITSTASS